MGRETPEAVFRALVSSARDAVMVAEVAGPDRPARISYVNEAFLTMSGFGLDELVGQEPGMLVGPDTDLEVLGRIGDGLREGRDVNGELVFHRRDGAPFRVEVSWTRVAEGRSRWYLATYRDLADRAEAEAALWRSEEWAQAILSGVSDLVVVADEDTTITWASPSLSVLLGHQQAAVVGRSALDFVHPDDVADAGELWQQVLDGVYDGRPAELRVCHEDGTWRWFSLMASNRLDHPAVRGVILTGVDVSERVAAEERLRNREQWAQALVQRGADIVAVVGPDGRLAYVSPAIEETLGYSPDDIMGMDYEQLLHPDDLDDAGRLLGAGHAPGSDGLELRVRHADAGWRILSITVNDLLDDPAVGGMVLSARDVTKRRAVDHLLAEQADLLEAIARGAPLEIALQKVAQMVEHVIEGARCAVGILDPDGVIRLRAAPSLPRSVVSFLDEMGPGTSAGRRLRDRSGGMATYDLRELKHEATAAVFAEHGLTVARVAPVVAPADGELLGSLSVFAPTSDELDPLEADLLQRALNLAAIAIERRRFESTLEYQALYDPLTGLPNRTLLLTRIKDSLARARRTASGVAVLFVDLDRFKVINDSVGHALGDSLLTQVAERFARAVRPGDTLGRFGGDEFMVVCSRVADEAGAAAAAERFLAELREPFRLDGGEVFVTASVGISFTTAPGAEAEALVRNADVAMYRAKDQGRNQYVVFQETLDLQAVERLALEQALRQAIDERQFELYFQPVVRLSDGAMTHVEALVRWHRPGRGMVPPAEFIPLAEETGLIVPLGWWILEEACSQAASWPTLPGGEQVEVAVNLSVRQLAAPELAQVVQLVLDRTGLSPSRLCFEVTESALVHDVDQATTALAHLHSLGVHLAIDDFGTGYASLEYVRHFTMADYLKIDRSFVEGVDRDGSNEAAIVAAAIALARSLGLTVVAEGVETELQMAALRDLDCDLAQGFLFSRPVPFDDAVELLASQAR